MKYLLVFVIFSCSTFLAQSQETNNALIPVSEKKILEKNRVGFTYSTLTGYGLTYLRAFDNGFSLKSQLFIYGDVDSKANKVDGQYSHLMFEIGAELQYNLVKYSSNRFYVLCGAFYNYDDESNSKSIYPYNYSDINRLYNIGIGFGFETLIINHISIALDGGYYGNIKVNTFSDDNFSNNGDSAYNNTKVGFGFGFGVSLYYNF